MHELRTAAAVSDLLAPYAVPRVPPAGRAWTMANMVAGLDGTAAFGGRVGPLSDGPDVELFRLMRALADVVLVGAETVRKEGYGPVRLPESRQAARVAAGRTPLPPVAVVSRSLDLDWDTPLFTKAEALTMVVTCASAPADRLERARAAAEVLVVGDEGVDLDALLREFAERGLPTVLCEGGPTLLGRFAAQGLLDELCLTVSPIMGGDPLPVALTPEGGGLSAYRLCHTLAHESTLFLRYERAVDE
ncbi:pyrimidine reductase family protein [Granulicoccus sp. GXG6511]|uniref:pyrimidine reductase family protein n=1 Tax=Granulicoccus sp. GXG6511 TaxID=3381351 RepID=UPI003D7E12CD